MSASVRLQEVQTSLESGEFDRTGFGSPEHGAVIELLMADHFGFDWEDGRVADARDSDGIPIQIKACQVEHSNGGDRTTPGRWDAWRETLLHLLDENGMYLLVIYDGDVAPEDMTMDDIVAWKFLVAEEFGSLIDDDAWHDHNRPSKGQRARVSWIHVFDRDEVVQDG